MSNKEISLDENFWNDFFKDWASYRNFVSGGVFCGIQDKYILDLMSISEDIKDEMINLRRNSNYLSTEKSKQDWIIKFKDVLTIPKNGDVLFLIMLSIRKDPKETIDKLIDVYGENIIFNTIKEYIFETKTPDIFYLKHITKFKSFKGLDEEDKVKIYKKIIVATQNKFIERDYKVLGLKTRIMMGDNQENLLDYISLFKNDAIFVVKAEKLLKKDISFQNETLNIDDSKLIKKIQLNVDNIMRISKLSSSKANLLVKVFFNRLDKTFESQNFATVRPLDSSLTVMAKNLAEMEKIENLFGKEMTLLKKGLPEIKFSNEQELSDVLDGLNSVILRKELSEKIDVSKPIVDVKKIKI